MTFLPATTPGEAEHNVEATERPLLLRGGQEREAINVGAAPPIRDDCLQTSLTPEGMQTRLLKLYRDARTFEEEQGVNILYLAIGFLEWYEDENSDEKRQAPLLLVPVVLQRRPVRFSFALKFADGEILTNLSLQAKLLQSGVQLPDLPDNIAELEPGKYFREVEQAVAHKPRWRVLPNDIVLWFFSFSKYLMYRDLDPEIWKQGQALVENPLMRGLLHQEGFQIEAPLVADDDNLDERVEPKDLVHVLDADSSQTKAIFEVARGRNLVIQGPPGTGKSQTIANLIAAAVRDGKTVLFLAEKQAALDVVKRYLEKIGLEKMCLELHSRKARRQHVREDLRRTLQSDAPAAGNIDHVATELKEYRDRLNRHVLAIHARHAPSSLEPYRVIGELARLQSQNITYAGFSLDDPATWSFEEYSKKCDSLADLATRLEQVGDPQRHPWRGAETNVLVPADINLMAATIRELIPRLDMLIRATKALGNLLTLPAATTLNDAESQKKLAEWLAAGPPMDRQSFADGVWDACRPEIERLVQAGGNLLECQTRLNGIVAEIGWATDVSQARIDLAAYGASWFRVFRRAYREAQARLRGILVTAPPRRLESRLSILDSLIAGQKSSQIIEDDMNRQIGSKAFGSCWHGLESDWPALSAIASWEAKTRSLNAPSFFRQTVAKIPDPAQVLPGISRFAAALNLVLQDVQSLFTLIALNIQTAFGVGEIRAIRLDALKLRLAVWSSNPESIAQWHSYRQQWRTLSVQGMAELADLVDGGMIEPGALVDAFKRAYFDAIIKQMFLGDENLANFNGDAHSLKLERFKTLDSAFIELRRQEVAATHHQRMAGVQSGFLVGTPRPLRRLLSEHACAIQKIKPVFMMSPISVAQFLEPGKIAFDLLLIDEASQVRPEDALGAVARSKQMVVVGDEKQLPPTAFFDTLLTSDDGDAEDSPAVDVDSILELGMRQNLPQRMLRWHYRSRHHSLIAVSNHEFYDDRLYIAINPEDKPAGKGLKFRHVPDGVYDRGGSAANRREAQVVADAIMDHARNCPDKTLGVGAFSLAQRNAILDELEIRRRREPGLEAFFSEARQDPFFVKNLESIQGDERDVIFLSVGYGRDQNGRITMNFGPLSAQKGERRLNVLITRARERCEVFSSIMADDINLVQATGHGPRAFKTFLKYAQTGLLEATAPPRNDYDSEFEKAVAKAVVKQGYEVHSQVGVAGFFIDLAVVDPQKSGRYLLGIECDGASYHSSLSARDRDRLRQEVLENQGWIIHRIWSTDWFKQPDNQFKRTLAAIEAAKIRWAERDHPREPDPPPAPDPPSEPDQLPPLQPWQMRRADWRQACRRMYELYDLTHDQAVSDELTRLGGWGCRLNDRQHKIRVEKALQDGQPVPPEVRADYPDLG
jgi:very-short-patch-repair endonuclease